MWEDTSRAYTYNTFTYIHASIYYIIWVKCILQTRCTPLALDTLIQSYNNNAGPTRPDPTRT